MIIKKLLVLTAFLPCAAFAYSAPAQWTAVSDKSSIEWTVNYGGKPVKGSFPEFSSNIVFDPEHLDTSSVSVSIPLAKVKSEDKDAQANLPENDWFAARQYPVAVFTSNNFRSVGGDNYEAAGTLTIRDKTVDVKLPFTVKFSEDKNISPPRHYAIMDGETIIKRLDFGVGSGDWAKTDVVANEVKLSVHLAATLYSPDTVMVPKHTTNAKTGAVVRSSR